MRNSILLFILLFGFSCFGQKNSSVSGYKSSQIDSKLKDSLKILQDTTDFLMFKGKYDKVVLNSIDNIKFAEKIGDEAAAYYSKYIIAMAFLYLEDYENSHKYAKEYSAYTLKSKDTFKIARAYNLTGALYLTEKKYDSAQIYLLKALPLSKKLGDTLEVSIVYYNLSESNLQLGNQKKAEDYFKQAKKGIDALNFKGLTTEMNLLEGKLNIEKKQYDKAVENLKIAIAFAEDGGYIDDTLIETYKELSNALYLSGDLREAFNTRKTYDSLNLLQFEKNKVMAVQNANAQFNVNQFKKQANEAELQKQLFEEKAKWNNSLLYFFAITAILLVIFLVFVGRLNSRRKNLLTLLKQKNKQYLLAKEKSEQLALAKTKFFSTISHELRTPLYGVIGLSSGLLEDESLFKHKDDLKNLKFSADYLLALINDVLDYSKIEATTHVENAKHFSIRDLIGSISISFKHILEENHNNLKLLIAEDIPKYIYGDRIRLMQILMNLVGNATKFTANGLIEISIFILKETETELSLTFSIRDTGIGIPEDLQQTIFEEFQQIENAKNMSRQGTGLGLPIVKKLLEQSNSSIRLKSTVGKGSEFSFDLTFLKAKNLEIDVQEILDKSLLQNKKILIVDDNKINQIVTKKIVEQYGMNCIVAFDGETAIEIARNEFLDIILMDINMPGKNGYETTSEIRKFNKDIPIIALTAMEMESIILKIKNVGMNDVIVKPYEKDVFLRTLLIHLSTLVES